MRLKKWLTRLGFVLATVTWTALLYGALAVVLEARVGAPTLIVVVLALALAVAVAARFIIGRVF